MNTKYKPGDIVLGNWTLVRLIGEGNYGSVFEAEREDFGSVYKSAIKIITIPQNQSEIRSIRSQGMDDESLTAYFQGFVEDIVRESALMSRLKGTPNVVSYEDHSVIKHDGEIGWNIIIRMELLTPLYDYSKSESFTRQTIIKLGVDICSALELCQKHNIVHRDIKPENIFVSDLGDFKLGDFGIARTVEKTSGGLSKKGTYTYMAPEVYRDEAYGPSVDIYSLGIVLYRLLNDNRTPFLPEYPKPIKYSDQEAAKTMRFNGTPLPAPKNADGRIAEIVLKACAFDPNLRHSSPMQLRQELEAIAYSTAEAPIIYPKGDSTPVKSVDYIDTEAPEGTVTTSLFADFHAQDVKKSRKSNSENTNEATVSLFGDSAGQSSRTNEGTVGLFDDSTTEAKNIPRKQAYEPSGVQVNKNNEYTNKEEPQKDRWQKALLLTGIGAASLLVFLVVVIFISGHDPESSLYVENVFGQNWVDAENMLREQGFSVTIVEEYHDTMVSGSVHSQSPAAGAVLVIGETVVLSVSRGAEPTAPLVPDIQPESEDNLEDDGVPEVEFEDDDEPEGESEDDVEQGDEPTSEPPPPTHTPVESITGVPTAATVGTPLTLSGTVAPSNATNSSIAWSVANAGGTGATISGNALNATAEGTVTVRATVVNGSSATSNFTQDFNITVSEAFVPVTSVTGVPTSATAGTPLNLSGTANPSNATNRNIAWSVASAGDTGASISENTLNTTASGVAIIRTTVTNGETATSNFTQDFSITVRAAFVPVTSITGVPMTATAGQPLTLSGTANPSNATNRNITWSVVNAGGTGATISGNRLSATSGGTATIRATVVNGRTQYADFTHEITITVAPASTPPPPAHIRVANITGVPSNATVGTPLTLSGTVAPNNATNRNITWSVASAGGTGATISGNTLNATSAGTVTVRATITNGATATTNYTQDFRITVAAPAPAVTPPTITATSLPGGIFGETYTAQTLAATGGTPITWSIESGSLPDGLSMGTGGIIGGRANDFGTFNFTVRAENAGGYDTRQFTITIHALTWGQSPFHQVSVGQPFTMPISITGATPSFWTLASGQLPPGVSFCMTSGTISGTPTTAGTFAFSFRIEFEDVVGAFTTDQLTIAVQ
ncbi:MAG: protein kinase [Defluviitaleaceae bacterium]|nr:protein kinase [Defluviitaleaceae bacterium]